MTDIPSTIVEAGRWLRHGRLTAVQLATALLERSHAAQDSLAAFITLTDGSALAAAHQADGDFRDGIDRGPLQGMPIGIKDNIATADAPTTANSHVLDPPGAAGRTQRWYANSARRAPSSPASWRCTSSPVAGPIRRPASPSRKIRGTPLAARAVEQG